MSRLHNALRGLYARLPEETVRYVIAGVCSTLVDMGSFMLLTRLGMDDNAANAASIALAILFAYVINKLYVFRRRVATKGALALEFMKFVLGRLLTALLEYFGYPLLLGLLTRHEYIAKGLTIIVVFILNYIISKLAVFGKAKGERD